MLLSHQVMSDSPVTTWTVVCQASLSVEFPRREYRSRLPFPSPGDLPSPSINWASPALAGTFFNTELPGKLDKGLFSQSHGFSNSHVWMWELDYKESWALKNWCFWTVVLEKTLESPLDCKQIQPVNPKRNKSWIFIGRTDAEAETPTLWPHDGKNWLTGKDPDAGKDWRQEEKGMTEDEMVGWYHQLNGHKFEQALGVGEGQGNLAFCSPWVTKSRT